ncbi:DUF3558 family protein [Nocardia salmonicida]|uniref:DUF3558 family protein n=1 Tax=Nocardia salmonicida TaxID=53431 RepID=UPI000B125F76|nr:DUF3558 family protein [Nocardia salmonicida]
MRQTIERPKWYDAAAVTAVLACILTAGCSSNSGETEGEAATTTVSVSVAFDPCKDLTVGFIEKYGLKAPGRVAKEPMMSLRDAQGCYFETNVAEYSRVTIGLNDARLGSADELEHPPRRKVTIADRPAEMLSWRERPGQAGKPTCSIQIQLARDSLFIFYSDGMLPLPDDDYSCRRAMEMGEDLVRMIEAHR